MKKSEIKKEKKIEEVLNSTKGIPSEEEVKEVLKTKLHMQDFEANYEANYI